MTKSKLYFAIRKNDNKDFIVSKLLNYKNENNNIKSFNNYEYSNTTFFNIYFNTPIKTNKDFDDLTNKLRTVFNNVYKYTYKNDKNEIVFKSLSAYDILYNVNNPKYKPKLYAELIDDWDGVVNIILTELKNTNNRIEGFDKYSYKDKEYFNIYLKKGCEIKTIEDFENITMDFCNSCKNKFWFKYKNDKNEILFKTPDVGSYPTSPSYKLSFIDDE